MTHTKSTVQEYLRFNARIYNISYIGFIHFPCKYNSLKSKS